MNIRNIYLNLKITHYEKYKIISRNFRNYDIK